MTFLHYISLGFFGLLICNFPAHAASYLDASTIPATLIAPPLATDSPEWNEEIEHIIALQERASAQELEQARAERNMTPERVAESVNPKLTRQSYPALYAILNRVADTTKDVTNQAKNYWNTKRPYLMDKRIKALIDAHDNPAYPSGHTSGSYAWAYVLALVWPEQKEKFLARAEEIAQHRVLVGMHYPHDVKGGKQLASLIMDGLLKSQEFQKDLMKVQEEARIK